MRIIIVVLFAMSLAVNAKLEFNDFLQPFEETNNIEEGEPVSRPSLPMDLGRCSQPMCEQSCWRNGWQHGMCISSTRCHCYNDYDVTFK